MGFNLDDERGHHCTYRVGLSLPLLVFFASTLVLGCQPPPKTLLDFNADAMVGMPDQDVTPDAQDDTEPNIPDFTGFHLDEKLFDPEGVAYDYFGSSVHIQANYVVIGSRSNDGIGRVYVQHRDATSSTWSETVRLEPEVISGEPLFGWSLDTSMDGTDLIVGAPMDNEFGEGSGAAYIYKDMHGSNHWSRVDRITATNPTDNEMFGRSVAINKDGTLLAVGAPGTDLYALDGGAVYLMELKSDQWVNIGLLVPDDPSQGARFGHSVLIYDEQIIVGAPGWSTSSGAVLVFTRQGQSWVQRRLLPKPYYQHPGSQFGNSLAADQGILVVGAMNANSKFGLRTGAAHLFTENHGEWSFEMAAFPPEGEDDERFGISVGVSNGIVVIGAKWNSDISYRSGAVYIYDCRFECIFYDKILNPQNDESGNFGRSLSISGDVLAIGLQDGFNSEGVNSGIVAIYR